MAIELEPTRANRFYWRAKAHEKLRNYDLALADLTASLQQDPKQPTAYFSRALVLMSLARHGAAVEDFCRFFETHQDNAPAFFCCGMCLQEIGQPDVAMDYFKLALAKDPAKMFRARSILASHEFERGNRNSAISILSEGIESDQDPVRQSEWRSCRAAILRANGSLEQAKEDLGVLRQLDRQRIQKLVSEKGRFVWGALTQANSKLFTPGLQDLPCLVAISFEPALGADVETLCRIAKALFSLKGTTQNSPDLKYAATLTTDEFAGVGRRWKIPQQLTAGATVFAASLLIRRHMLRSGVLNVPVLPCVAVPGDTGGLELLPFDYKQKRTNSTPTAQT